MFQCPVCLKSSDPRKVESHGEFTLYNCPSCDVVYSQPMKNPGAQWYEKGYVDDNMMNEFLPLPIIWWHRQFLESKETYGKDLLDIGCGTGRFLSEARSIGYRVAGIDFNSDSIRIARKRFGLNEVENLGVDAFSEKYPEKKFDVITFFEVLEHMEDPNKFISQVKTMLKPGGTIALSVPNRERALDSLGEGDYPPHHLTRWTKKALQVFLEMNGFEVRTLKVREFTVDDVSLVLTQKLVSKAKRRLTADASAAASENRSAPFILRNYQLIKKVKDYAMRGALLPLIPALKVLKLKGWTIFCTARMK